MLQGSVLIRLLKLIEMCSKSFYIIYAFNGVFAILISLCPPVNTLRNLISEKKIVDCNLAIKPDPVRFSFVSIWRRTG